MLPAHRRGANECLWKILHDLNGRAYKVSAVIGNNEFDIAI